jgi:hypothetical protein
VGQECGPRSLLRIIEELLGINKPRLTAVWIRCADHATPYAKVGTGFTGCGDPSVGIVRLRTKSHRVCLMFVKFEVFTAVTMKNGVFLDVTPCGSCKNRRFGGT